MAAIGYNGNTLSQVTANIEGYPNIFIYSSLSTASGNTGDAISTINGTNYFSDGQKRGLTLGSIVFVVTDYVSGAGVPLAHICAVTAVQSGGYGVTTTLVGGTS